MRVLQYDKQRLGSSPLLAHTVLRATLFFAKTIRNSQFGQG